MHTKDDLKKNPIFKTLDRTWAEIDLSDILENAGLAKGRIPEGKKFISVVKADAYGHGASRTAGVLEEISDMFAVASLDEGIELRLSGIRKPILVLGVVSAERFDEIIKYDIMPTIFTLRQAEDFGKRALERGLTLKVTIALDTGMGRIGIKCYEEGAVEILKFIANTPGIKAETVFSHFSGADCIDKSSAIKQEEMFRNIKEKAGLKDTLFHIANSAGIIESLGLDQDMVRDGISLYGYFPSNEVDRSLPLRRAMSWRARISHIKTVPAGTAISYGSTFIAEKEMRIATIAAGYGDGLPRRLSNTGEVLINGRRAKILGRVCMDQFMVDVSAISCEEWDIATILGRDGEDEISLYEWEEKGLFSYECLCNVGKRVKRIYFSEGRIIP